MANNATQDVAAVGSGAAQGFAQGGPIGAAAGAIQGLASALLGQHTARLKGAKTENAALVQVIPAFDADLTGIINAYNTGQATAAQAVAALQSVDAGIKKYLMAQVGKPGTSWNEKTGVAGKCDKTCTAGCCIYYGDLGPPLSLAIFALGGQPTFWASGDPRISSGPSGVIVTVPQVFASKYGGANRASYSVTILNRGSGSANPPQFAQTGLPTIPPRLGLVSDGTVQGQTTPFSYSSQGLLNNASAVYSPMGKTVGSNTGLLLIGAGAVIVVLVAVLASK